MDLNVLDLLVAEVWPLLRGRAGSGVLHFRHACDIVC